MYETGTSLVRHSSAVETRGEGARVLPGVPLPSRPAGWWNCLPLNTLELPRRRPIPAAHEEDTNERSARWRWP